MKAIKSTYTPLLPRSTYQVRYPLIIVVVFLGFLEIAYAAQQEEFNLNWIQMIAGLLGGLALFLFGLEQMTKALKVIAGNKMKNLLKTLTKNRFTAVFTGTFVTAVIQSASVTTVLVVGFISTGLMSMSQSIGIIMGANIGSTITAQIIAFQITKAALFMIAIGFGFSFFFRNEKFQHYGVLIMGLGMIFFGMHVMSESMYPLHESSDFQELITVLTSPINAIIAAAIITALIQSASATIGLVIVIASQGFISLESGIALVMGSNIGTCITALLAAIGKPTEAVRAAVINVLFNVFGVMIWIVFIPQLALVVTSISPAIADLDATARMTAQMPRQIANAHTIFNIANTLIFVGFTSHLAKLVERLIPERVQITSAITKPKYLDKQYAHLPFIALERVRMELTRLGKITLQMLEKIREAFLIPRRETFETVANMDDQADMLYEEIVGYLGEIRKQQLTEHQSQEFLQLMNAAENLERIGDVIETSLVDAGYTTIDEELQASETIQHVLDDLFRKVYQAVELSINAVANNDELAAHNVISMKNEINHLIQEALNYQAQRMNLSDQKLLYKFRIEDEIIDSLKRIYALTRRIAKSMVSPVALEELA